MCGLLSCSVHALQLCLPVVLLCDSALVRETCQDSLPVQTGLQRKGVGELGEGIPRRRTGDVRACGEEGAWGGLWEEAMISTRN